MLSGLEVADVKCLDGGGTRCIDVTAGVKSAVVGLALDSV